MIVLLLDPSIQQDISFVGFIVRQAFAGNINKHESEYIPFLLMAFQLSKQEEEEEMQRLDLLYCPLPSKQNAKSKPKAFPNFISFLFPSQKFVRFFPYLNIILMDDWITVHGEIWLMFHVPILNLVQPGYLFTINKYKSLSLTCIHTSGRA